MRLISEEDGPGLLKVQGKRVSGYEDADGEGVRECQIELLRVILLVTGCQGEVTPLMLGERVGLVWLRVEGLCGIIKMLT